MSTARSSPWYSTPRAARRRKVIGVTLSDEAQERLAEMAEAQAVSRSRVLEGLIMANRVRKDQP